MFDDICERALFRDWVCVHLFSGSLRYIIQTINSDDSQTLFWQFSCYHVSCSNAHLLSDQLVFGR